MPKDWTHKFVRKVQASQELYSKFISGAIDTPEKFEAKRMELAEHVWKTHEGERFARMPQLPFLGRHEPGKAESAGRTRWHIGQKEGKTCIDCHKGIAHLLPKEYVEPDE